VIFLDPILRSYIVMVQKRKVVVRPRPKKAKKPTPFADAGAIAGDRIGRIFGYPMLKGVGRWLGSGIGNILGSGDYQMMGGPPKYNVLTSDVQVPQFSTGRQTNIVCHREYLTDIVGTSGFDVKKYPVNPGVSSTFPWLSTLAQNYQEYRIHGIIFEFRSLITDFVTSGAPGVIVMATNYNADAPLFSSKQEMENSEYAVATKPTLSLIHGLECAAAQTVLPEKYIRSGDVPVGQDLRMYDLGNVQVATQGNPAQLLGELWISYCVEFFKPRLPATVGGNVASGWARRTGISAANPYGTTTASYSGSLGLTFESGVKLKWYAYPGNRYFVQLAWSGTSVALTYPSVTTEGLTDYPGYVGAGGGFFWPAAGTSAASGTLSAYFTCSLTSPGLVTVSLGTAGTLPTGSNSVVCLVTSIDEGVVYG
jgi:hypothetical protein